MTNPLLGGPPFGGLRVVTDRFLTETVRVEHDRSRFIDHGPEDERWRRYFGFVTDEVRPSSKVYQMGDTLVMHPAVLEQIRRAGTECAR